MTTMNAVEGYGYGALGWKLEGGIREIKDDLVKQVKDSFKSVVSVPQNLQSAGYLMATVMVASLKLVSKASKVLCFKQL